MGKIIVNIDLRNVQPSDSVEALAANIKGTLSSILGTTPIVHINDNNSLNMIDTANVLDQINRRGRIFNE